MKPFAVAVLAAGAATAQLGSTEAECGETWGSSVGGRLDEAESGLLHYSSRGVSIELEFFEGKVFRARYHKIDMNEKDVDSLLRLNNNNVEWVVWTVPGIPVSEQKSNLWMRSDEAAMAELNDGKLGILGTPPVARSIPRRVEVTEAKPHEANSPVPSSEKPEKTRKTPVVQRPEALPVAGDSQEYALQLLGEPTGTMMTGKKEILIYEWGNIWVAQGKVISVN